jgi:hypothetical protein
MVKQNKNIVRVALGVSYILMIALLVSGIGAIFAYLNTGADRSKMLHTEIKNIEQYLPKVVWEPLNNKGRKMSFLTLDALENDYLDAWYVKNLAYQTNTKTGIEDYYTESARKNIYQIIAANKKAKTTIAATSLSHHITLDFFSEDGQIAVITDENVLEYKRVLREGQVVLELKEISTYKVVFLLEDGFWRIRHFVKTASKEYDKEFKNRSLITEELKGINYYPQKNPWKMFTDDFDASILDKDFKIIGDAGLNTIRVFVPYAAFGAANVQEDKVDKLGVLLDLAARNKLNVMITLFDFYGDYSVVNWTLNQRHAEKIVTRFKGHKALLAWDIKNEPDLDFESRGELSVKSWLISMIHHIKSIDKVHPVTIGWSNATSALILKDNVDFVSFHYYKDVDNLAATYQKMQVAIPEKPIVMSEFGKSSYNGFWNLYSGSENAQAAYHQKSQDIIVKNKIPNYAWTLYDFNQIPEEVIGGYPWRMNPQKKYGFLDENGQKKVSFSFILK